jgi:hypothetical protein
MASPHQGLRPVLCKASRRPARQATKAVHFDKRQYVRHFYPDDLATGASSAERGRLDTHGSQRLLTWEMTPPATTLDSSTRTIQPVRLEQVWLSPRQTCMHGSVSVSNLAFAKSVACRLSLDSWTTVLDFPAEYKEEVLPRTTPQGHDRFTFAIPLPRPDHLETIYFCLRYSVNGQEFWDNNNGKNFRLDFKKVIPEGSTSPLRQTQSCPPARASQSLASRYNFAASLKATMQWPRASDAVIRFHDRATFDLPTQMRHSLVA